jgi:hypothetical protein
MVEYYLRKILAESSRFGPLHPYVTAFSDTLVDAGYARITVKAQLRLVGHPRSLDAANQQAGSRP